MIRRAFSRRFRALLSGAATGIPPWTPDIASGDDPGLFRPVDAPWVVHADIATTIGGIRALLLQALHPGSLAGVVEHSRYEEDVVGRLNGTIRWLTIATFGSRASLEVEAARVRALHEQVRGTFTDSRGEQRRYRASDADLLQWVHVAFTDSFLRIHERYGRLAVSADDYVREWGAAVRPLGLDTPPLSEAQLREVMNDMRPHLRVDARTRRVVRFVKHAPLPMGARPVYRLLFWAAVDALPREIRNDLQLRCPPHVMTHALTKATLAGMRFALGSMSPLEAAALERLARLDVAADDGGRMLA